MTSIKERGNMLDIPFPSNTTQIFDNNWQAHLLLHLEFAFSFIGFDV